VAGGLTPFGVALAVRLLHTWQLQPSPFFTVLLGDARAYDRWAQNLAAGDWIGSDVFYQAPLYPYFLGLVYALFDRDLLVVRIIQALIGSVSCALLGLAAARFFSARAGLLAGLGLALWAPAIFFDSLLQKSVLDVFFVCLGLYLIAGLAAPEDPERGRQAAGSWLALGLAMGGLALTRENALVFVATIVVWAWLRPGASRSRRLLPFAAGLLIVLAPVVARNYAVDGGFYLTTSQFGPNFYIGNNPQADGTYAPLLFGRGSPEFERQDATDIAAASRGRSLSPSEVSSFWTGRAFDFITAEPLAWLRLMGRKALLLINRHEMLDTESLESYAAWSTPLAVLGPATHFGLLVPLAVLGAIVQWRDRRRLRDLDGSVATARHDPWILYALALSYAASVVLFYVFARYRYPLVPFLLLFAAAAFDSPFDRRPRTGRPRWLVQGLRHRAVAVTVLAAALLANLPMLSPTLMQAITENNLATALQEHGRYEEAIRHHERAIALQPDYAPAYNNLGAALRAVGRADEAIVRYRQALDRRSDFPSATFNLANALLARGDREGAIKQFGAALQAAPGSVEAQTNLGAALAAAGDTAGAMAAFRAALRLDDRSVLAHRNLGVMLIESGARAEGRRHLERAIALAPAEPEAHYDLGTVLLEEHDGAGAARLFEAALRLRADWPEAHNNLGIALASQGRLADALIHFERALRLKPDFADARVNRDQAQAALRR
jgi:tetratricopeptide (TPR) repeat protein